VIQLAASDAEWVQKEKAHDSCGSLPNRLFLFIYLVDTGQPSDAAIRTMGSTYAIARNILSN
jgi:hypothetical protein